MEPCAPIFAEMPLGKRVKPDSPRVTHLEVTGRRSRLVPQLKHINSIYCRQHRAFLSTQMSLGRLAGDAGQRVQPPKQQVSTGTEHCRAAASAEAGKRRTALAEPWSI